ncbi:MAG: type II toxin-antitoxin system prevent-host-death family antitoxin [Gammaproteobacteria bacterium]|nr:type II toxin-antitoxin system prevent-host-death family antitoxin [Gammaproteobacteria bacterium]
MEVIYSVYEAKARFSEVIRQVREGKTVTVSYRGEPVAEISPIKREQMPTLEHRLDDLERQGVLVRSHARHALRPAKRREGALARFLEDRHE